jgi:predicted enzyme related to lactoylglutathione lyase
MANSFFWYDVMTTDTAAAQAFYADVVGWQMQDAGAPGMPYTILAVDGMGVAGLMPIPSEAAGARPCWMGYIHVEDVDAMAERVKDEGGAIHRPPFDVPGVIRIAVVADPQGAVFMLGQPLSTEARPMPPAGSSGTIGWNELYALDAATAFGFYETLFEWTRGDAIDMGPMGAYQMFLTGGEMPAGGMMTKPAEVPNAFWNYYINVVSVEAAAARIKAGGGQVAMGPHEVPGGQWVLQAFDPQGGFFSLVSQQK